MIRKMLLPALLVFFNSCGNETRQTDVRAGGEAEKPVTNLKPADSPAAPAPDTTNVPLTHQAYNQAITSLPSELAGFVPEGYAALDTAFGDANLDPHPDVIMILKKDGEETSSDVTEHPEKRPLLILTGQQDGSYRLAGRTDNAVYCIDCGGIMGDPFMNVVIKNGYFSIEHAGGSNWRWTRTVTFRYSAPDGEWYLHKDGGDNFHASEPEKVTTKIKTVKDFGKVALGEFDIYKEDSP